MNIEPLQAEEVLQNPAVELTPDGVYQYMLLATGDETQAQQARVRAILADRRARFLAGSSEGI
jgi:hypothetical protein